MAKTEGEILAEMLAGLPSGESDMSIELSMRECAANGIDDASWEQVPKTGLRFHRIGYVPYVDFDAVCDALLMSPQEFHRQWVEFYGNGIGCAAMLEYDDLWDFLVWLAGERHPVAARVWLHLYLSFEWGE